MDIIHKAMTQSVSHVTYPLANRKQHRSFRSCPANQGATGEPLLIPISCHEEDVVVHVCASALHTCMCNVYLHVCKYVCVCVYACMCTNVCVCKYVSVSVCRYVGVYLICMVACIHVCLSVCM